MGGKKTTDRGEDPAATLVPTLAEYADVVACATFTQTYYGVDPLTGQRVWPNVFERQRDLVNFGIDVAIAVILENRLHALAKSPRLKAKPLSSLLGYLEGLDLVYFEEHDEEKHTGDSRHVRSLHRGKVTHDKFNQVISRAGFSARKPIGSLTPSEVDKLVAAMLDADIVVSHATIATEEEMAPYYSALATYEAAHGIHAMGDRRIKYPNKVSNPQRVEDPRIRRINEKLGKSWTTDYEVFEDVLEIVDNGPKEKPEVFRKAAGQAHTTGHYDELDPDCTHVYDLNRMAFHPASPAIANRINYWMQHCCRGHDEHRLVYEMDARDDTITSYGYADRKSYPSPSARTGNFPRRPGHPTVFIPEIIIIDKGQWEAKHLSDELYDLMRHYMNDDRSLRLDRIVTPEDIHAFIFGGMIDNIPIAGYNEVMRRCARSDRHQRYILGDQIHREQIPYPDADGNIPIAKYRELFVKCFGALISAHQSIHMCAALDAPQEWKEHYVNLVIEKNDDLTNNIYAGELRFPLDRYPKLVNGHSERNGIEEEPFVVVYADRNPLRGRAASSPSTSSAPTTRAPR